MNAMNTYLVRNPSTCVDQTQRSNYNFFSITGMTVYNHENKRAELHLSNAQKLQMNKTYTHIYRQQCLRTKLMSSLRTKLPHVPSYEAAPIHVNFKFCTFQHQSCLIKLSYDTIRD
ncbi:hypothetical protein Hdeb2414_s0003g00106421 [Helianthus debilis subsp. tardiflorus]